MHPAGPRNVHRIAGLLDRSSAPVLLLLMPFAVFLKHHEYAFRQPEILFCVFLLIVAGVGVSALAPAKSVVSVVVLAGLLTFFSDIQFDFDVPVDGIGKAKALVGLFVTLCLVLWLLRSHAARVITLMAATFLVSTLLLPNAHAARGETPASPGRGDLPVILHVILDEHIGVEGLPVDITPRGFRADVRSFYEDRGFRLFGGAYSEYGSTERSIGHLLDLAPVEYSSDLVAAGTAGFSGRLTRSSYFARLAQKGYAFRIYQSDFLDLCLNMGAPVTCDTYSATGITILQGLPWSFTEKVPIVAGAYLNRSTLYGKIRKRYSTVRRDLLARGMSLPNLDWEFRLGPLTSLGVLHRVKNDLAAAKRGQVFFAHFLLPHSPYIFDERCDLQKPGRWLSQEDPSAPAGMTNTSEGRTRRYSQYIEQLRCTQRKVGELIEAIPETLRQDAVVIVQGDHGSRITLVDPRHASVSAGSVSDYVDTFSTLFAVKAPGLEAGYDTRLKPVTCILKALVNDDFRSVAGLDACGATPSVYVDGAKGSRRRTPLLNFVHPVW